MMQIATFEFTHDRPGYPDLRDIVPLIPDNTWHWWILELDAFGVPARLIEELFGGCIRSKPVRPGIAWQDLIKLAATIDQTIDLLVVATRTEADFVREELDREDFSHCVFMAHIFDSSEAILGVPEDLPNGKDILQRFLKLRSTQ